MTREEIEFDIRKWADEHFIELVDKDVWADAKRALQAQADGEYISRQAVLNITWEEPSYTDALNILTEVRDKVKALPSVKPQEPKTGHWKRISMDRYTTHAQYWYECDKCGEHNLGDTDFCPYCGADMRGENDGNRN